MPGYRRSHDVSGSWPASYEVRIEGALEASWSEWFEGLDVQTMGEETILSGALRDRSALYGVLDKVRDLGLSVITVRRLSPREGGERL